MPGLAVDISNWNGALSAAAVTCWAQNGVQLVIVQAVNPPAGYPTGQTIEQLQACQDASMGADLYVFYWPKQDPAVGTAAITLADGFGVGHTWMDCEANVPAGMSHDEVRQEIRDRIAAWGCDGIYTRRDWWVSNTGDWDIVSEYPDIMLWDADWDGSQTFDLPEDGVYGGWTAQALKQYGSGTLCSMSNLDMNVINEEIYVPAATYVGDDYWAKFGPAGNNTLANRYDWPGVAANLEGIIHQIQQQTGSDAECEAKLQEIESILNPPAVTA